QVSTLTIHCFQTDDILGSEASNCSGNISFASRPLAEFASYVRRQWSTRRTGHQLQTRRDLILRKHVQKGRLVQRNGQRLFECVIENRITRAVGKISEYDGV